MTLTVGRSALLTLALLLGGGGGVASAQDTPAQLAQLARDARSPKQHADVARRYRVQAEALDVKAADQEKQAASMTRHQPGIAHKWPSMVPKALTQAKHDAMDTRRAARESRELADRHQRLAVEAMADQ